MHLQLYQVTVHADTTRHFTVPAYDIPIIKAVWRQDLRQNERKGWKIEVQPTGQVEPRSFHDERLRLMREYHIAGTEDPTKPVWRSLYPNDEKLLEAWQLAVEEGTEVFQKAQEAQAKAAEAKAKADTTENPKKGGKAA